MVPVYGICLLEDTCVVVLILSAVAKEGSTIIAYGRFEAILLGIGGSRESSFNYSTRPRYPVLPLATATVPPV